MRVFITGATGFIGSYLVPELLRAGHQVIGLSRSQDGAETLVRAGAEAFMGDVNDLDRLRVGVAMCDAVIHAAFNHDFARVKQHSEEDRTVVEALGEALAGSDRPLIVTSGTGLVERRPGEDCVVETDPHANVDTAPRAATDRYHVASSASSAARSPSASSASSTVWLASSGRALASGSASTGYPPGSTAKARPAG